MQRYALSPNQHHRRHTFLTLLRHLCGGGSIWSVPRPYKRAVRVPTYVGRANKGFRSVVLIA